MKKSVFLLMLTVPSISVYGEHEPIERTIEQITVGKTLKVQAARILKEKGLNTGNKIWDYRENPEEAPIQIDDSISHMGREWDGILFNTTASKVVHRLCFLQNNKSREDIDTTYKEVRIEISGKYAEYIKEENDYYTTYTDGKTEISLWKTSDTSLRLCYYALTLSEEE